MPGIHHAMGDHLTKEHRSVTPLRSSPVPYLELPSTEPDCKDCVRYIEHIRILENRVLRLEHENEHLMASNKSLKDTYGKIYVKAEQEEEYISNVLLKRIQKLKNDKEMLAQKYEQEEERITNELMRKMQSVKTERDSMHGQLQKEHAHIVERLVRTVKKTECELDETRKNLDRMRKEKIDQENALENEQEMLYNTLGKQMEHLNSDKRRMEKIIQQAYERGFLDVEDVAAATSSSSSDPLNLAFDRPMIPLPIDRPPSSISPCDKYTAEQLRTLRHQNRRLEAQLNEFQHMEENKNSQIRMLEEALSTVNKERDEYNRMMDEVRRTFNSRVDTCIAGVVRTAQDAPMGPPSVPHTPRGQHESVSDMDDASSRGSHRESDYMN